MARVEYEPEPIARYGREEFLTERFRYRPGEHLTMLAPTQNGKTTTMFALLAHLPEQKNPPIILVMKPRDKVVLAGIKKLKYRIIRAWPPLPSLWQPKPKGYALWPKHTFDPDVDDPILYREMRKGIIAGYKKGDQIVVADETYGLVAELNLGREITAVHSRGAGMGVAIWCMTQKPTHIGKWAYSQAEHLFLGFDPDKTARDRFAEIGGVDPDAVKYWVSRLQKFEWLYIRRTGKNGPVMCVVEAA